MALTNQPQAAGVAKTLIRTALPQLHGKEKASSTWKAGAFLIDDDAGFLTESTSALDGLTTVAKRTFGMAMADATGVTGADVLYVSLLHDSVLIEITLSELTAGTHTLAQTDMFKIFPVTKATANWYLNADAVSDTGGGMIVEFVSPPAGGNPIGTVDARVLCRLTHSVVGTANAGSSIITATNSLGL